MKDQIAAGTTHLGQYSYLNMNYGLCRILLATINGNVPLTVLDGMARRAPPWWIDNPWDSSTISAYASTWPARSSRLRR